MVVIGGVDEAGRGPVIGPMVMALCAIDESEVYLLQDIGVKDSKEVAPARRKLMETEIKKVCKWDLIILSPQDIDVAVLSKNTNLNWLEADTTLKLMRKIMASKYYVDCPSNNTDSYKTYLQSKLNEKAELIVEHKADSKYLVSAAASILAKVKRDSIIQHLKVKYNVDFGSGYPADPITREFLKKNWNNRDYQLLFRKSWASYTNLSKGKSQQTLSGF